MDERLGDRARRLLDDDLGHHLHRRRARVEQPGDDLRCRDPGQAGHGTGEREPVERDVCHDSMFAQHSRGTGARTLRFGYGMIGP